MGLSVPKRRLIKFRRRGITQKKAYNKYGRSTTRHQTVFPFPLLWTSKEACMAAHWSSSKIQAVHVHAMKAYGWVQVHFQSFLTAELDGGDQLYAPAAMPWEKKHRYSINRRLGGPQRLSAGKWIRNDMSAVCHTASNTKTTNLRAFNKRAAKMSLSTLGKRPSATADNFYTRK
jgi:hypothetical protein